MGYRDQVDDAVSDVYRADGEMLTRWVMVAETVDGDGERSLHVMSAKDMWDWEALGMLKYAEAYQQAGCTSEVIAENDGY